MLHTNCLRIFSILVALFAWGCSEESDQRRESAAHSVDSESLDFTSRASCADQTCSDHGTCVVSKKKAICKCDAGYTASALQCISSNPTPSPTPTPTPTPTSPVPPSQIPSSNGLCKDQECSNLRSCVVYNGVSNCSCDAGFLATATGCKPLTAKRKFYVRANGNDAMDGLSEATAWKTISRVNQADLDPGDHVLFEGGSQFSGSISLIENDSGSAVDPVFISSFGNGRAKIQSACTEGGYFGYNTSFVHLADLNFVGCGQSSSQKNGLHFYSDKAGYRLNNAVSRVEVSQHRGGIIVDSWTADPALALGFDGFRVTYSSVHDNLSTGLYFGGATRGAARNIYVGHAEVYNHPGDFANGHRGYGVYFFSADRALVERSVSFNNGVNGKESQNFAVQDADRITFQYCESYGAKTSGGDGNGFIIDTGSTQSTVQYSYTHGNQGSGYQLTQWSGSFNDNTLRYNISVDDSVGIGAYGSTASFPAQGSVYNNTIINANRGTFMFGYLRNLKLYNNIFMTNSDRSLIEIWPDVPSSLDLKLQGNLYWSSTYQPKLGYVDNFYSSIAALRQKGPEMLNGAAVGVQGNPLLVAPPSSAPTIGIANIDRMNEILANYRLTTGSPAKDAGIDLKANFGLDPGTKDFSGQAVPVNGLFDIGAYELR
jgi:hypothetical protein